jgi:hypothetical protein
MKLIFEIFEFYEILQQNLTFFLIKLFGEMLRIFCLFRNTPKWILIKGTPNNVQFFSFRFDELSLEPDYD